MSKNRLHQANLQKLLITKIDKVINNTDFTILLQMDYMTTYLYIH